ncbi:hypothetical protein GALL_475830 [mine drainage metagenome]|uniref:Uncharacterized protein n=1 Tax=mine drainage metagenome TaxID=410659 RepID=A0A1J5PZX3_9ZZZZ
MAEGQKPGPQQRDLIGVENIDPEGEKNVEIGKQRSDHRTKHQPAEAKEREPFPAQKPVEMHG